MVAEMVAILTFDMSEIKLNSEPLSKKDQIRLFGSSFEKLGQHKRVEVLTGFKVIKEDIRNHFITIKNIRKKYLHFWSEEQENIEEDARTVFGAAVQLVGETIGNEIKDGKLKINPPFRKYLKTLGIIKPQT